MGSFTRTAPRLISAAVILLGCAPGPGNSPPHGAPAVAIPSAWAVDPCVVVDTTGPTADTLYTIGVVPSDQRASVLAVECRAAQTPTTNTSPSVVSLAVPPGADLRELLDGTGGHRLDVLVTRDANVLAYVAGRPGYFTAALPWTVTYVLVPARANSPTALPPLAERNALARDAVTADARGAAGPFPWLTDSACAGNGAVRSAGSRAIIAYVEGDTTARQLAERVVSLAGADPRASWISAVLGDQASVVNVRISALSADSIPGALASGRVAGALIPIARDPRAACFTAGSSRIPAGAIPLVDVRAHVVVRRESGAAFIVSASGSFSFFRRGAP